ncbi:MAG: hypothetical protein ACYYK0_05240 [Candidatus Eutrophobiaceae bacterium]
MAIHSLNTDAGHGTQALPLGANFGCGTVFVGKQLINAGGSAYSCCVNVTKQVGMW